MTCPVPARFTARIPKPRISSPGYEPLDGASNEAHDDAVRLATLKIASRLAEHTKDMKPVRVEAFEIGDVDPALPRVVYVDQVMHQASMVQTFMYGRNLGDSLPTLIHPNEMLDGAVVGANYKTQQKAPTYLPLQQAAHL